MNSVEPRYVIVTPVRDEEQYLALTVESVLRQSIRPAEYVIVNDGSQDRTGEIIEGYARQYPWIRVVHRADRGHRKPGAGIIEAFYSGFNVLTHTNWDFMAKLDGDLSFAEDYFENLFERFNKDPKLGIAGGTLFHTSNGCREIENCPSFHVRGGAKVFRRSCWDDIGGLWVGYGSDTIDEVKANMLGWKTKSFPELLMHHHRYTGASYGRWGSMVKDGRADYASGYHPLFLFAKCVIRLRQRPYFLGSAGLMYGYLSSYAKGLPRVDEELRLYIRQQQIARLCGKPTIWK